jgi:hypothetical protein
MASAHEQAAGQPEAPTGVQVPRTLPQRVHVTRSESEDRGVAREARALPRVRSEVSTMRTSSIILGAIACLVVACAETPTPAKDPVTTSAPTPRARATCPLGLAGTMVAVDDTPDGVDVTFRTDGNVTELQKRAAMQAANHGPGQKAGLGHGGMHNGAHTHGLRLSEVGFPVHTTTTNTADGARVHVAPDNAANVVTLRQEIRERAAKIVSLGDCPP